LAVSEPVAKYVWRDYADGFCYSSVMEMPETQNNASILKLEKVAPAVYQSLQDLKRTGWVKKGVENPESVKEHTEALIKLANEFAPLLTENEIDGLIDMLEIHDWPEAIHGDEVILELNPDDQKALKEAKFENERKALAKICNDISGGEAIMALWLRFETSNDPAAQFGRQLDKYQAVEKALEYEQTQGIALFDEFLTYSIHFIHHPVLLQRIEQLKMKWGGKS
jgi:putative hydrolase of HD superfamily